MPGMAPRVSHRIAPASRSLWFSMYDWVSAERRAHAGPNAISGKARVFVSSEVGELLDIGSHAGEQ